MQKHFKKTTKRREYSSIFEGFPEDLSLFFDGAFDGFLGVLVGEFIEGIVDLIERFHIFFSPCDFLTPTGAGGVAFGRLEVV